MKKQKSKISLKVRKFKSSYNLIGPKLKSKKKKA